MDVDEEDESTGLWTKVTKQYMPLRMDFKSPAEHQVEDAGVADLEVQISLAEVDALEGSAEAKVDAVMSVFYNAGTGKPEDDHNKDIAALKVAETGNRSVDDFSMSAFVNGFKVDKYFVYDGSLTEPPCTEDIKWILLPDVKTMSSK